MRKQTGFTLIEIAIVLVIVGLLLGAVLMGQELIQSTRVRNLVSEQDGIKAAFYGFQDRFHAYPGDYSLATTNINGATMNGNGNGRIETNGTPCGGAGCQAQENIGVWDQLSHAGFINGTFTWAAAVSEATNPRSPSGIYLDLIYDNAYGLAGSPPRYNLKSGGQIAVGIIAEVDRKIDDGMPYTGAFQFSTYLGNGAAVPTDGAAAPPACTSATTAQGIWNATNGSANCGGANLF
jgi:prepilin-type N-terminal cleavage/methylation domain-containing protein